MATLISGLNARATLAWGAGAALGDLGEGDNERGRSADFNCLFGQRPFGFDLIFFPPLLCHGSIEDGQDAFLNIHSP